MNDSETLEEQWINVAWSSANLETMEQLIMSGVNINKTRPSDNWTALHCLVWRSRFHLAQSSAVELLLRNGADPHIVSKHRRPLDLGADTLQTKYPLDMDVVNLLKQYMNH